METSPEEIKQLKAEFEGLRDDVKDIKDALIGNKFVSTGLINQFGTLLTRVDALEKWRSKYTNILVGLSIGSGFGLAQFFKVLYAFLFSGK
jgi:hypothetical protein